MRRSVCFSLLILPHHGNDAAQDRALAAVDGLVVGVCGHEPDLAALALERFDRRLVTKQRDHDLPVLREVLAVDDDKVVRQDADAEHRLAAHTQGEILVIVPAGVERQVVLDALLRQNRVTGGNIAEDRHLAAARGKLVDLDGLRRNGNGLQLLFERDGTALARALLNEPHLLQVLDMEVDRGG